jgi:hypothetical protein
MIRNINEQKVEGETKMTTVTLNSKRLAALIELSNNVKVYVPSTCGTKKIDNTVLVTRTLAKLTDLFGGATSFEALGCWKSDTDGLIKERVTICQSYCTEAKILENIDTVVEICEVLKKDLNQEAVSLEVNNKLYLI